MRPVSNEKLEKSEIFNNNNDNNNNIEDIQQIVKK